MAFSKNGLARIGSSQTGKNGVPTVWQYVSDDDLVTIGTDGYFNEIRDIVTVGDRIFFNGDAGTISTSNFKEVPESGDVVTENGVGPVPIASVGTDELQDNAVTKDKLEPALQPSNVIKYAGNHTTVGGSTTESFSVVGVLTTDNIFCSTKTLGTTGAQIIGCNIAGNDLVSVIFDIDPGNDHILAYQVIRDA